MCCGLLFSILAIILGHVAYCNEQRSPDQYAGKRMAIAGFTTGYVGLLMGIVCVFGTWCLGGCDDILNEYSGGRYATDGVYAMRFRVTMMFEMGCYKQKESV